MRATLPHHGTDELKTYIEAEVAKYVQLAKETGINPVRYSSVSESAKHAVISSHVMASRFQSTTIQAAIPVRAMC